MSRPRIILADTDYGYLASLELKFAQIYGNVAELIVITDPGYFVKYFSTHRSAEVLVISERLYSDELLKHEISGVLILTEQTDFPERKKGVCYINKFASIKNIISETAVLLDAKEENVYYKNMKTTVITVCAADGGAGKTSIAMALSDRLVKNHRRVFYLNTEKVQSFRYYLNQKQYLGKAAYQIFWKKDANYYQGIRPFVRTEGFSYLPPFSMPLDSMQISYDIYFKLIEEIKISQEYDYIVVDTDHACEKKTARLMAESDYVVTVSRQDEMAAEKMKFLLNNLDYSSKDKYLFVCNKYDARKWNGLKHLEMEREDFKINEYVNVIPEVFKLQTLSEESGIKNLAYIFL